MGMKDFMAGGVPPMEGEGILLGNMQVPSGSSGSGRQGNFRAGRKSGRAESAPAGEATGTATETAGIEEMAVLAV